MYIGCGICGESWQVLCYSPEVLKNSSLLFFLEKSVGKAFFSVYRGAENVVSSLLLRFPLRKGVVQGLFTGLSAAFPRFFPQGGEGDYFG